MKKRIRRITDRRISDQLATGNTIVLEGIKGCGKSETGIVHSTSRIFLENADKRIMLLAENFPEKLLHGKSPLFIDEIKLSKGLSEHVFENNASKNAKILATSVSISDNKDKSDAARVRMRPLTTYECLESEGRVSLASLFKGDFEECISSLTIPDYSFMICRGGWPEAVKTRKKENSLHVASVIIEDILDRYSSYDGRKRNRERTLAIMRALSKHISTTDSDVTVLQDVRIEFPTMDINTFNDYQRMLCDIFIRENLEVWKPELSSKARVRTADVRYFTDPSIHALFSSLDPDMLSLDMSLFLSAFRSLAVRDIRVYAEAIGCRCFHYRDTNNASADMVLVRDNGDYGLLSFSLKGKSAIDETAATLKKCLKAFRDNPPSFMVIVTPGDKGYMRDDGINVVPLGSLMP